MRPAFVHVGKMPGMNEYTRSCRTKPQVGHKMKKDLTDELAWELKAQKVPRYGNPIRITLRFFEPKAGNNQYRDLDNISGFARKCLLDAMQDASCIHDDGPKHVVELHDLIVLEPKGGPYRLEVFIEEVERNDW